MSHTSRAVWLEVEKNRGFVQQAYSWSNTMKRKHFRHAGTLGCLALSFVNVAAHSQALENQDPATQIRELRQEVDALRRKLTEQDENFARLSRAIDSRLLDTQRGTGNGETGNTAPSPNGTTAQGTVQAPSSASGNAAAPSGGVPNGNGEQAGAQPVQQAQQAQQPQPVGQAPVRDTRPPEVAPIFDQPGVLTPRGKFVVEPSMQFGYSSSDRVALVGYTIIPALLIGLIDVRQVKTTSLTGALAVRYGITNRLEFEVRAPYVYTSTDTVSREIFTGTAVDNVFSGSGRGIGDVEMTLRYQLNEGGPDKFYYIGWLRFKTRTGKDPFEVVTDCVTRCVGNTTGTGLPLSEPTGSGFYALQPGLTWLFPTDPVVFFGNFSYLHSFSRDNLSLTIRDGQKDPIGKIQPGDIFGFNIGMGLALNEKASFSIGYDQSIVWPTKQNGQTVPGSVRVVLGTLLVGYSYRLNPKTTMNFSIGAGLTRDTPDLTLTLRVPISF
jgi:hypothetical protein